MIPFLVVVIILSIVGWATHFQNIKRKYRREVDRRQQLERCLIQQEECSSEYQAAFEQAETERNELRELLRQVESDRDELGETLQQVEQQHKTLQGQFECTQTIAELENAIAHHRHTKSTLQAELNQREQNLAVLSDTLNTTQADLEGLENEKNNIQKICKKLQQERITTENCLDLLEREKEEFEQEISRLEIKHDYLYKVDNLLQENEKLKSEKNQLKMDNQELRNRSSEFSNALSVCKQDSHIISDSLQRINIVSACHRHDSDLFHIQIETDFARVIDALKFAGTMFNDVLEVWDSAYESANISGFKNSHSAYISLQKLAWFGRNYFQNDGSIGLGIDQCLKKEYNLDCSNESDNVKNSPELKRYREFKHRERQKYMFSHLKLGGGNGIDHLLRIYFYLNLNTKKVEIGHCGRHLPT